MDRSRKIPENQGIRIDDPGAVPVLSLSGVTGRFTGLNGSFAAPWPTGAVDLSGFGTLKDNRVNRWTVRDRPVRREDQAVGVEPV